MNTSLSCALLLFTHTGHAAVLDEIERNTRPLRDSNTGIAKIGQHTNTFATQWNTYITKYLKLGTGARPTPPTPGLVGQSIAMLEDEYTRIRTKVMAQTNAAISALTSGTSPNEHMQKLLKEQLNISPNKVKGGSSGLYGEPQDSADNNDALNIDALLNSTRLSIEEGATEKEKKNFQAANNFITLASGLATKAPAPGAKVDGMDEQEWARELLTQWGMLTKQSIAMSNLYDAFQRRVVIPNLGTQVNYRDANNRVIPNASTHEIELYLVNKRSGNPVWYAQMEQAAPITVARETAYLTAESQRQMLHLEDLQERTLITMSALLTVNVEAQRAMLELKKEMKEAMKRAEEQMEESKKEMEAQQKEAQEKSKKNNDESGDEEYKQYIPE